MVTPTTIAADTHAHPRSGTGIPPILYPPPSFATIRPGRTRSAEPQDSSYMLSFGADFNIKDASHTRIFYQNIKGLSVSTGCEDFKYCLSSLHNLQVDYCGIVETNLPWTQAPHLQSEFRQCLRRQFTTGKAVFGSPSSDVDPVTHTTKFQAGGNASFAVGALVPMVASDTTHSISDPSGMGHWSGPTIRGKDANLLSIITAYRVCRGSINTTTPMGSALLREHTHLQSSGDVNPNPRRHIIQSLITLIKALRSDNHSIILMLDANSTLADDPDLQLICQDCSLSDLHSKDSPPSTYLFSSDRRIDYDMLGCPRALEAVRRSGSLSYQVSPQSDHRGLFIDIDIKHLLGYDLPTTPFTPAAARILKTDNPVMVAKYVKKGKSYYESHNMRDRIDQLYSTFAATPRETVRRLLEA